MGDGVTKKDPDAEEEAAYQEARRAARREYNHQEREVVQVFNGEEALGEDLAVADDEVYED